MSSLSSTLCSTERRLKVLLRIHAAAASPPQALLSQFRLKSSSSDSDSGVVRLGDVSKPIKKPANPELVPYKYLPPQDKDVPPETLKVCDVTSVAFFSLPIAIGHRRIQMSCSP